MAVFLQALRKFDAFPKLEVAHQTRSTLGGVLSFAVAFIICFMVVTEVNDYWSHKVKQEFVVDKTVSRHMRVNFDLTVATACQFLRIDVIDEGGASMSAHRNIQAANVPFTIGKAHKLEQHIKDDFHGYDIQNILRQARKSGRRDSPSSVTPESDITNTGCRIFGKVILNKVSGILHITAHGHGHGGPHVPHEGINHIYFFPILYYPMNFTHRIDGFSFGSYYPGVINPLDNTFKVTKTHLTDIRYYISVIETMFVGKYRRRLLLEDHTHARNRDHNLLTDQYSVKGHQWKEGEVHDETRPPGIYFDYMIEPISVIITRDEKSLLYFLVRLCAATGGVFVTAGIVYRVLYRLGTYMLIIRPSKPSAMDRGILGEKSSPRVD
ncbi:hypothetical protein EV182_004207 [Spiromyces aspiralis]|uniref:Uncharacterized protein n=1 Tax=Spiromyces aspiralis TaxID=68401 RepID=A0ACC1HQR3_9FUNG|nr:hypothetical protein EV182_004207 [Spiromyces aspiralis]